MIKSQPNEISLEALRLGDQAEFARLVDAYSGPVYRLGLRMLGNEQDAEDVLQESLIAVWQGAPRFRGEGRVVAWLLSIVHHKALNAIRAKMPALLDEEQEELPDFQHSNQ